jgi:hypothetical protein
VYDVHERIRDMNRNGILASMCFPTFTGFSARHLNQFRRVAAKGSRRDCGDGEKVRVRVAITAESIHACG